MDFMCWLVSDSEAAQTLVDQLGVLPYKDAPESVDPFYAQEQTYEDRGNYIMTWNFSYTPNVDEFRSNLVSALNAYNDSPSDSTWEGVRTAFVDGWAEQYKKANG